MVKFGLSYILEVQGADGAIIEIKSPMTLNFAIKRNAFGSANTASFSIINLSEPTRNQIYKDIFQTAQYRFIRLRAGYETNLPVIFQGNIKEAKSYRMGGAVDFVTEIDAFDYGYAMTNAVSSFALGEGSTKQQTIEALANDVVKSVPDGSLGIGKIGEFSGDYPRGRSVAGSSWEYLRNETDNGSFIDNGLLYCLNEDEAIIGDVPVLDSRTGLIGSPKKADALLEVEMVFEPSLKVGQAIELNSRTVSQWNGKYKVWGVDHAGTISGSVSGKCKTIAHMLIGQQLFEYLTGES